MEQAGEGGAQEECRHEWRHGSLEGYATVAWSMEGRAARKERVRGGPARTWGSAPPKPTLLRQGQAGIAVQRMKMALFDEGGVGGGQDIEIIDAGERKALDGSPVSLAVAGAVVINDRFGRQAGADADRRVSGFCAQGFSQGTGASELASSGVHA